MLLRPNKVNAGGANIGTYSVPFATQMTSSGRPARYRPTKVPTLPSEQYMVPSLSTQKPQNYESTTIVQVCSRGLDSMAKSSPRLRLSFNQHCPNDHHNHPLRYSGHSGSVSARILRSNDMQNAAHVRAAIDEERRQIQALKRQVEFLKTARTWSGENGQ
eukprot:TRINITY_DN12730_c0_g1::TRINITY_DN12730_c0_g1_i1::g.28632::m.28632 TRINITY_DN12730_c0_g1::TRINITY_DN12730_c0_g1_i1::g.28632  ORF type:complete len:180 (+),score=6.66 TRINITY_DN12730_c0_g1_i1:61-540(+)